MFRILLISCLSLIFAQKGGNNHRADEDNYWYVQNELRKSAMKSKAEGLLEFYKKTLLAQNIEYSTMPYFQMIQCDQDRIFHRNQVNSMLIAMNPKNTRSTKVLEATFKNGNFYFVVDVENGLSRNVYEATIVDNRAFLIYEEMTNCNKNLLLTSILNDTEIMSNISRNLIYNYRLGIKMRDELSLQDSLSPNFILQTCSNYFLQRDQLIRYILTISTEIQLSEFKIIDGFDVFQDHFTFMIYVSGSFIRFSVKYIDDKNRYQFVSEFPQLCRNELSETTELIDPNLEDSKYLKEFWMNLQQFSNSFNEKDLPKLASDSFFVDDCDDQKHKFLWFMDNLLFQGYFKDAVIRSAKYRMITGNIDFEVKNYRFTLGEDKKLRKVVCI